jgi:uncharacterized membrane protein YGL010W
MATLTDSPPELATRRVDRLLAHYEESHSNPVNTRIHCVAVPLIMLSLLGLMWALHPAIPILFVAASMVYYARLSAVFLLSMAVASSAALLVVWAMGERVLPISLAIFVASWIAQAVGHKIEGRKPSFFEDLQYLWVGPIFLLGKLFRKLGIRW